MVNYANGKIYKIESNAGDEIYIGSTAKKYLSDRMSKHRSDYKRWKAGKEGKVASYDIFDKYGVETCYIVLLEAFSCESKDELTAREKHHIKTTNCVNKRIPGRTKEEAKEAVKQWTEDNKEHVAEYHKQKYEENKDERLAKMKVYREKNALNIKASKNKVEYCECGKTYRHADKAKHCRSKFHIDNI